MKVEIKKIKIKKRIRKDLGDLSSLMHSMTKHGLLNPIIINSKNELLAGYRRLMAAKKLRWKTIDAKIMDVKTPIDKLDIELEENMVRKEFTPQEIKEGLDLKKKLTKFKNLPWIIKIFYKIFDFIINLLLKIFTRSEK